ARHGAVELQRRDGILARAGVLRFQHLHPLIEVLAAEQRAAGQLLRGFLAFLLFAGFLDLGRRGRRHEHEQRQREGGSDGTHDKSSAGVSSPPPRITLPANPKQSGNRERKGRRSGGRRTLAAKRTVSWPL